MTGLTFAQLWDQSRKFRQIFFHKKAFDKSGVVDMGLSEALWYERHPEVEWGLCLLDGCDQMAMAGSLCLEHSIEAGLGFPKWEYRQGRLYRYVEVKADSRSESDVSAGEYMRNDHFTWNRYTGGKIPNGYHVRQIDRNPFNENPRNLVLITRYSAPAFDEWKINAAEAIAMDDSLPDILRSRLGGGGRRNGWCYNINDLASLFGIQPTSVRANIANGSFDPSRLSSIAAYYNKLNRELDSDGVAKVYGIRNKSGKARKTRTDVTRGY